MLVLIRHLLKGHFQHLIFESLWPSFCTGVNASAISAGYLHACALLVGGSVACWGFNGFGELGIGSTNNVGGSPGQMGSNLQTVKFGTGKCWLSGFWREMDSNSNGTSQAIPQSHWRRGPITHAYCAMITALYAGETTAMVSWESVQRWPLARRQCRWETA